ncbi:MAG TPA: hypothetical protein VFA09_22755 [Ktedonobacteraceae bacterium]|nr:hypothetical protein [Ktedonobacteraceae bacterium]
MNFVMKQVVVQKFISSYVMTWLHEGAREILRCAQNDTPGLSF